MSDETKIAPALTPEEWREKLAVRADGTALWPISITFLSALHIQITRDIDFTAEKPATLTALIALANAALPDDDQRKITRTKLDLLREAAEMISQEYDAPGNDSTMVVGLRALADALASYLPPE